MDLNQVNAHERPQHSRSEEKLAELFQKPRGPSQKYSASRGKLWSICLWDAVPDLIGRFPLSLSTTSRWLTQVYNGVYNFLLKKHIPRFQLHSNCFKRASIGYSHYVPTFEQETDCFSFEKKTEIEMWFFFETQLQQKWGTEIFTMEAGSLIDFLFVRLLKHYTTRCERLKSATASLKITIGLLWKLFAFLTNFWYINVFFGKNFSYHINFQRKTLVRIFLLRDLQKVVRVTARYQRIRGPEVPFSILNFGGQYIGELCERYNEVFLDWMYNYFL